MSNISNDKENMKSIVLAIGVFILCIFIYGEINTNHYYKNDAVYSSISESGQQSGDSLNKYDSVYDFPLDEILYSDAEAFTMLESAYQEVDFYGDFKPGDLKLYSNLILNVYCTMKCHLQENPQERECIFRNLMN